MSELAVKPVGAVESSTQMMAVLTRGKMTELMITHITDLPAVVLGSILARLNDPVDVAAAFCTCKLFWTLARTAPFQLRLRPRQTEEPPGGNSEDSLQNKYSPQTAGFWDRAALCGIRKYMCGTRELDLAGCSVVDEDVGTLLADLQSLQRLILDGCQKLTSVVADTLVASIRMGPCSISLQRCFGLGPVSAGNLLVAAGSEGSRLHCMLLSHLDRLDVPRMSLPQDIDQEKGSEKEVARSDSEELAKCVKSISNGAGLRILALNNCVGLGGPELASVAILCPQLELLLLGGSVEGLGLSRAEVLSQEQIAAAASTLIRTIELLPRLRVLELTYFTSVVVEAVREQDQRKIHIWDFCDESSVAAAAWVLDDLKELKHGSAVNNLLRNIVGPVHCATTSPGPETTPILFSKSIRAQFWQDGLTLSECLGTGSFSYTSFKDNTGKSDSLLSISPSQDRWESLPDDVALALRGAANCSDIRRRTPLHMAAARGDVPMIAGLLTIGAATVGMKDSSGATSLFVAAESGYAHACELLLQGGADVLASNRAGETPLYIAALRGHSAAVGIMLAHCHEHGVNWQDADVYGMPLLPHIVPSLGGRNFARRSLKMYSGTGLQCEGQPDRHGSRCFPSCLWEPASGGSYGIQVNLSAAEIVEFIAEEQCTCKLLNVAASLKLFFEVELNLSSELVKSYNIQQHASDGWTPLMAAVVADRRDVGTLLLWAAGAELGLGSTQEGQPVKTLTESIMVSETKKLQVKVNGSENLSIVTPPQLLDVQNRYGQTALHIAAQKGSVWFVESLLSAGALVDVQNSYGLRALDVAKQKKQKAVADILREWEAGQGGKSEPTDAAAVGKKKSTRKSRKNKGKTSNGPENQSPLNPTLDYAISPPCCPSSAGDRTVLSNESISELIEAIALLPNSIDDPCQDPSAGVADGLVVGSEHVVNSVHGFVKDAVSDSHSAVIHRQNESNCMIPCSCHPVPNPL